MIDNVFSVQMHKRGQQGLGSAGKVRSLRLTSLSSIPAASGLLLVGCCVRDLRET